jgi:hypothetical protein
VSSQLGAELRRLEADGLLRSRPGWPASLTARRRALLEVANGESHWPPDEL